jgi:hypothetical protein
MKPSLPLDVPQGATVIIIKWPDLECSMIRAGQRCNNLGEIALIYPSDIGYEMIPICQMCMDDSDDDWISSLERHANSELFPWSKQ